MTENEKSMIKLICGNCTEILPDILDEYSNRNIVFVSDPPYNLKYHYNEYSDNMNENEYYSLMSSIFSQKPSVIIHYPESLYRIAMEMNKVPLRVVSWCYPSNTPRQHRDIAFFGVKPDFRKVTQPYKNPNDKRIKQRIADGKTGCKLYDWWEINQVKNVSSEKTAHPCQIPLKVMTNIIGILPEDTLIIDPFVGSGTTIEACKNLNRDCIGIDIDEMYINICKNRVTNITDWI